MTYTPTDRLLKPFPFHREESVLIQTDCKTTVSGDRPLRYYGDVELDGELDGDDEGEDIAGELDEDELGDSDGEALLPPAPPPLSPPPQAANKPPTKLSIKAKLKIFFFITPLSTNCGKNN